MQIMLKFSVMKLDVEGVDFIFTVYGLFLL